MAEQVDLGRVKPWAGHHDHSAQHCAAGDRMMLRLVDELRLARKVVEEARVLSETLRSGETWLTELARLLVAIEVYDQAGTP